MKSPVAFVVLLLMGTAIAEDAPVILSGSDRNASICRGKDSDVPGCVTAPRSTYAPDPSYPEKARKKKQNGDVVLQLVVGTDGLTHDVKVERGVDPDLDEAAIETVKRWKFSPASRDGRPIAAQIEVAVTFRIR